jgi:hypothetical protein
MVDSRRVNHLYLGGVVDSREITVKFSKLWHSILILSISLASGIIIPCVRGYGSTLEGAETIMPGTVNETLDPSNCCGWYKIYCMAGDNLTINLKKYPGADLELQVLTSDWLLASSNLVGSDNKVTCTIPSTGYYLIMIYRGGASGIVQITMTVSITSPTILLVILMAVAIAAVVVVLVVVTRVRKNRKKGIEVVYRR